VRYVPNGAGEKYEKWVGPAKKWGISVFYYPRALNFFSPTDSDQISHEVSPWDVPHQDSRINRKRGQTTEKVEKSWGKSRFLIPKSYKIFVNQLIFTKFHTKVDLLVSHITIVKFTKKWSEN
jgi:hypothetical protein